MQSFSVKDFTVLHHKNHSSIANARIIVNAGKCDEVDPKTFGVAHYLEHMMFKGTQSMDYKELNQQLANLGDVNAFTSDDITVYHLTFLSDKVDEALKLLTDMVFRSTFPVDEFEKERGVIFEEYKTGLDNAGRTFGEGYNAHLFGDRFGHSTIGTEESIKNMKIEDMLNFHKTFYRPNNIAIAVTGNIAKGKLKESLTKYLPKLSSLPKEDTTINLNVTDYHLKSDKFKQSILYLNTVTDINFMDEIKTNHLPDIFNNALGGGLHSLLFNRIREELGLCYSIGSYHSPDEKFGRQIIFCYLNDKNISLVVEESAEIIEKIKKEGISPELLHTAKTQVLFQFGRRMETSSGLNSMMDSYFMFKDYPLDQYLSIERLKQGFENITNQDIIDFANRVYGPELKFQVAKMTYSERLSE